jgi:hypothetical protein
MKNSVAIKPEDERISERARYIAAVAKAIADTKARYPRIGTYIVVVRRRIEETASFVVEAEDKEQASQVALEACMSDSTSHMVGCETLEDWFFHETVGPPKAVEIREIRKRGRRRGGK